MHDLAASMWLVGPMEKLLFIQKNNDEGRSFYYRGRMEFLSNEESKRIDGKGRILPVVSMRFRMEKPVAPDLHAYLVRQ
ncbi:MAG: DUF3427 domain-containing protein [Sphaerochaetaceae bacterium]|jgi:hypothetical protein|nr:DUF3427 domain-containing protein [Sphaerochaetaceae bacterium]MDD3942528.1 DUF3427 domain-containing protein [Sphaerochaetaceae bacterium]MDX9940178.1 DUF3427 domain-containing protein [Sphaerochaetaceae bacterium]